MSDFAEVAMKLAFIAADEAYQAGAKGMSDDPGQRLEQFAHDEKRDLALMDLTVRLEDREALLQKERSARRAAQEENTYLKEKLARAGLEQRNALNKQSALLKQMGKALESAEHFLLREGVSVPEVSVALAAYKESQK